MSSVEIDAPTEHVTRRRGRPSLVMDEDAVLDAAVAVLATQGPAATLHDISARCGIAKATLSDRFGGKQALLDAAVERERRRLADHLIAAYEPHRDATAREQVERGFQAFFAYAHQRPDAFAVLFGPAPASATDTARADVTSSIAELITSRFSAAGAPLDTGGRVIAAVMAAAGEAAARLVVEDGLDADVMARFIADLIVNGLHGLDVGGLFAVNEAGSRR